MAQVFHKVASNHQKWAFQNEKEGENVVVLRRQAIKKKIGIIIEKKFNYLSKKWELVTSIKRIDWLAAKESIIPEHALGPFCDVASQLLEVVEGGVFNNSHSRLVVPNTGGQALLLSMYEPPSLAQFGYS